MIFVLLKKFVLLALVLLSFIASADTLEIYLNSDTKIEGIDEAQDVGHTLVYYYFDGVDIIEQELATRATERFQQQIKTLVKKEGLQHLTALTDFQRNQLFLKQLNKSGSTIESISRSVVTPHDREAIGHALEDLIYAENNGVSKELLPAIIFKGRLFKNNFDLLSVIDAEDRQQ